MGDHASMMWVKGGACVQVSKCGMTREKDAGNEQIIKGVFKDAKELDFKNCILKFF